MRNILLLALTVLVAGCSSGSRPEPLWVGHLAPLTGRDREKGDEAATALSVYLADAKKEDDFTVGRRPVGVRHVDIAKGAARAEAVRLLTVNRVAALILGSGPTDTEEVCAAGRTHGTPVLVLAELAGVPNQQGVILLGPDPVQRGAALARFARDRLKATRVAVITDEAHPICSALAGAFTRQWRKGKGSVQSWDLPTLRRRSGAGELKRWKPDAILLAVSRNEQVDLEETLSPQVATTNVLHGAPAGEAPASWLRSAARKGPGLHGVSIYAAGARVPKVGRRLLEAVQKKRGQAPSQEAVLALDAIRLLREGLDEVSDAEPGKLPEALRGELTGKEDFTSVTGPMKWKDGRPLRPLFIVRYRGENESVVQKIDATP